MNKMRPGPYQLIFSVWLIIACGLTLTAGNTLINCSEVQRWNEIARSLDEIGDAYSSVHVKDDDDSGVSANICGNARTVTCCTQQTRANMMKRSTGELKRLIDKVNSQLVTYIQEKRQQLRDSVLSHLAAGETKMHQLMEDYFQLIAHHVRSPVQNLYRQLRAYFRPYRWESKLMNIDVDVENNSKLKRSVERFYSSIFPPVFACVVTRNCPRGFALKRNYSNCISEAYEVSSTFTNAVDIVVAKLHLPIILTNISLTLLDELGTFLNLTSSFVWPTYQEEYNCRTKLFKLYYCPICSGTSNGSQSQICPAAMTQVLESCLGNFAHFDEMFHKITSSFKTFTSMNNIGRIWDLEEKLHNMKYDVQDAILNITLNAGPEISASVYRSCGPVQNEQPAKYHVDKKSQNPKSRANEMRVRSAENSRFSNVVATVAHNLSLISHAWFSRTLVKLYETSHVSTNVNGVCWNGHSFVRYSKSLETLGSSGGASPQQAPNTLANSDFENRYKRISETLQTLNKFRATDGKPTQSTAATHVDHPIEPANFMIDDGSGDRPVISDDDDYDNNMQSGDRDTSSGEVGRGAVPMPGATPARPPNDEIGLEDISTVPAKRPAGKTDVVDTKKLPGSSSSRPSSSWPTLLAMVVFSLSVYYHSVRWVLCRNL